MTAPESSSVAELAPRAIELQDGDALVVVDVQGDFLPDGALGVPQGDEVVDVLNRYIDLFARRELALVFTRDWHPADHCSFQPRGGPWPPHCIAGSDGARFAPGLEVPAGARVVSKATDPQADAYSGFQGTDLAAWLHARACCRLFVGGLATDYCVLETVRDALAEGFEVLVLADAIRAVNVKADDGSRAEREMRSLGARLIDFDMIDGAAR